MHVPKTGGTWVTGALAAAGVPTEPLLRPRPGVIPGHADLALTEDYGERFTFAFVRHPLDWWRSFWGHRMRLGWEPDHAIDSRARSDDFNEFVAMVAERLPGHLGERYSNYIGLPDAPISYIGKYESLVDGLVTALTQAGEAFDEGAIRAHPRANTNDYSRFPAVYRRGHALALAESEKATIERFYRNDPIPAQLLGDRAASPEPS